MSSSVVCNCDSVNHVQLDISSGPVILEVGPSQDDSNYDKMLIIPLKDESWIATTFSSDAPILAENILGLTLPDDDLDAIDSIIETIPKTESGDIDIRDLCGVIKGYQHALK